MKQILLVSLCALALLGAIPVYSEEGTETVKGKPALVVMDIQNAYFPYMDEEDTERAMETINAVIDLFHKQGLPVIRVYHQSPEYGPAPGSEAFEFPDTVRIHDDDPKIVKNYPSAFKKTELEKILRDHGCDTVVLTGLSATGCVLATYFDAVGLELTTFMVKNGLISHKAELTRSVEEITDAVGYRALKYMIENAPR